MVSKLRVGTGFDIHRLVLERKLILGGMHVPHNMGLEGHSDGDVLIHAIIDALLGAANLGDIGLFFPSSDKKLANADSALLLAQVRGWLTEKQYVIVNIDSTIICERPKLSSWYVPIKANLSSILGISPDLISLKAKTAEGIGEIGKGEAIAVQSSVLIESLF